MHEKNLSAEIDAYDKKFLQWTKISKKNKITTREFEKNNKDLQLPREVGEFEVNLCVYYTETILGDHAQ